MKYLIIIMVLTTFLSYIDAKPISLKYDPYENFEELGTSDKYEKEFQWIVVHYDKKKEIQKETIKEKPRQRRKRIRESRNNIIDYIVDSTLDYSGKIIRSVPLIIKKIYKKNIETALN
ncbi:MAG: hypothetical protein JXR48_03035 [Candidatus Delongbacteria bacterium]|nr:hypothetical protein [Candidatus Delongbacteria bacterium]MBN2833923.1 hypothetical protein [Candidatus Delongbacteria bacterium]